LDKIPWIKSQPTNLLDYLTNYHDAFFEFQKLITSTDTRTELIILISDGYPNSFVGNRNLPTDDSFIDLAINSCFSKPGGSGGSEYADNIKAKGTKYARIISLYVSNRYGKEDPEFSPGLIQTTSASDNNNALQNLGKFVTNDINDDDPKKIQDPKYDLGIRTNLYTGGKVGNDTLPITTEARMKEVIDDIVAFQLLKSVQAR
jgi:hypothetical protein